MPSKLQSAAGFKSASELVLIAIGSNLGDPVSQVKKAMDQLQEFSDRPLLRSSLWRTSPVDCPPGSGPFVNAAVALVPRPGETPERLLQALQQIERDFGRQRKEVMNEPRPIDLDLIAFGREQRSSAALILPHPRAHLRRFVLEPLSEIVPDCVLPGRSESIVQRLAGLESPEILERISPA